MIIQCCVCKKIRHGTQWTEPRKPFDPNDVSHGYCPACAAIAFEEVRKWIAQERPSCASVA